MSVEQECSKTEVSRRDVEAKIIGGHQRFMGFLRKRLHSQQDAEDVFQDFCLKVLRSHASVKSGRRLDAWLSVTLRHTLTDHYRRRATRIRATEVYGIEVRIPGPEAQPIEEPACNCVHLAIRALEPSQAELLWRLDLQDEQRASVAADLGLSLNALGVRVHRSRAALKKKIAEICPVCGDGRFLQCDCDRAEDVQSLPVSPRRKPAA